jgi:hypothetical protein
MKRLEVGENYIMRSIIIRMMKSRRMRWAGHVARKGEDYWWESQNESDH